MPLLTTDRPFFFLADLLYGRFCTGRRSFGYKRRYKKHFVFGTSINPKTLIYFWHQKWMACHFSIIDVILLFIGKRIPPQVEKSTGVRPEIPIDDGYPPPPPHRSCSKILCIQCCSAEEGSLTSVLLFIWRLSWCSKYSTATSCRSRMIALEDVDRPKFYTRWQWVPFYW